MTPRSPSTSVGLSENVVLNVERIDCGPPPEFNVIVSGLKLPVNVALIGFGLVPPIAMGVPLKDSPSGPKEKYELDSVTVDPLLKCTSRLSAERLKVLVIENVVSGKTEEFGPVKFTMSNS